MYKILIGLTTISSLFATAATATNAEEIKMRPGLWQITTTSDLLLLAQHLPPDQIQNFKDLAKDYGLEMPQIENGAAISKTCITQEMVNQKTLPNFYQPQLGCISKNGTRNGNNYKIDFVCASPDLKGNGIAEGVITAPETFIGQTNFSGEAQGIPANERADINGKWINSSCGAVKPL
jgi:hypothetical protein